ncbi:ROK family protein [Spirulina subsalsa FACHB-351]|uniref:ROK family protein n=1 Tax=Spirulina subsalsa FACHB-351 TaxID=234711 RepID=A0ABT3L6S3_9CYAN|nr:ROK family protein [Spirulina subsalsa]MCW6037211.1 ROK family protein [Spirulina subsalsa FACHB-351]
MKSQDNPEVIGIDLGGTAIKFGRFLADGTCLEFRRIPTPQPSEPHRVIEAIAQTVQELNQGQAIALGVGVPGPADVAGKVALVAINLVRWQNVPLAQELEEKTGLPTVIANDANCAGLGEAWIGAAANFRHSILLTLGTGVGGAIILDGQLFTGYDGAAGELGLMTINPEGPPCNSGNRGSLEQHLSIGAIRRATGKDPAELGELANKGDRQALEFWQDYGRILGIGLSNLLYILTPEAAVIGGGVSASAEFFFPSALAEIEQRVLATSRTRFHLLLAALGNNAGAIGAARLAWQQLGDIE